MTETKRVWLTVLGYWFVFGLLCTILYPVLMSDSITRYAPMADAFAQGDWRQAFHPRFGVLFQVLCGSVSWLTGLPGAKSVQVVAVGFLALSGVPLFFLVKRLFNVRVAWWSLALLFVCDDFTRYAMDGLRDVGKCLAFALIAYGAVEQKTLWIGLGLFCLIALVSYGFAVASVLVLAWCLYALATRPVPGSFLDVWQPIVFPILGWMAGTASVTFMMHAYTGHWLPSPHYIKILGGLL